MSIDTAIKNIVERLNGDFDKERIIIDIIDKTGLEKDIVLQYLDNKEIIQKQNNGNFCYIIANKEC